MWIYSNGGMASIVAHRDMKNHYFIRARSKKQLMHVLSHLDDHQERIEPLYLEQADYKWRAIVSAIDLERIMIRLASAIDYPDFKGSIAIKERKYYNACLTAWRAMNDSNFHLEDIEDA